MGIVQASLCLKNGSDVKTNKHAFDEKIRYGLFRENKVLWKTVHIISKEIFISAERVNTVIFAKLFLTYLYNHYFPEKNLELSLAKNCT